MKWALGQQGGPGQSRGVSEAHSYLCLGLFPTTKRKRESQPRVTELVCFPQEAD